MARAAPRTIRYVVTLGYPSGTRLTGITLLRRSRRPTPAKPSYRSASVHTEAAAARSPQWVCFVMNWELTNWKLPARVWFLLQRELAGIDCHAHDGIDTECIERVDFFARGDTTSG